MSLNTDRIYFVAFLHMINKTINNKQSIEHH